MSLATYRLATIIALLTLVGCASPLPPALQTAPPQSPDFQAVAGDPARYVGARVRWGGVVIRIENMNVGSAIEVLARPLDNQGRPVLDTAALGRFLARTPQFLDPLIYKAESEVTLSGRLIEPQKRSIGDFPYTYPVVEVDALHLWAPRPERRDLPPYWDDPWYPWGYYPYPWWRHPHAPYW